MSIKHFKQSISGDFRGALQHLEEVADHIRSAQKTFEALPSTFTNSDMNVISALDNCIKVCNDIELKLVTIINYMGVSMYQTVP